MWMRHIGMFAIPSSKQQRDLSQMAAEKQQQTMLGYGLWESLPRFSQGTLG